MTHQHTLNRTRRCVVLISLVGLQAQGMSSAWAGVFQMPLLSNTANAVLPNFVLTLDNSGSMGYYHLPEKTRDYQLSNGSTLSVTLSGTDQHRGHPSDTFDFFGGSAPATDLMIAPSTPASTSAECTSVNAGTTRNPVFTIYECQYRSSGVNYIYYNPAIRYQPWYRSDQPDTRMAAAPYKKAPIDPLNPTQGITVDLSAVSSGLSARWCQGPANCRTTALPFSPAVFYQLKNADPSVAPPNVASSFTKYDLNNRSSNLPWDASTFPGRTDCPSTGGCPVATEQANYANWFTYYRNRILLTKGALTEAFAPLGNNLRLGWGALSYARYENEAFYTDGANAKAILGGPSQGVAEFSVAHKVRFLTWLQEQPANGSTPTRFAMNGVGEYYNRTDAGSPWRYNPASTSTDNEINPILGCRRGSHILTTDGYYNDDIADVNPATYELSGRVVGEVDANNIGTTYVAQKPYADAGNKNSLADIAMKYWATPMVDKSLFVNTSDTVKPTAKDPATWLHVNQYMVGLGLSGTVDQDNVPANINWPLIDVNKPVDPGRIDDMIHAGLNSRGRYFTAQDSASLRDYITKAIDAGSPVDKQEAGVNTSAQDIRSGDLKFIPQYNPGGWYGDVNAYAFDANGNVDLTQPPVWRASAMLPAAASRNIVTLNSNTLGGVDFKFSDMKNMSWLTQLPSGLSAEKFINYLRGDNSQAGVADGDFRLRAGPLGDIINSTPVLIKSNLNMGYDVSQLPSGGSSYAAYITDKAKRSPVLFVGANDGMLHAFDASSGGNGGAEVFAYVPRGTLGNLSLLADQGYRHQFYVDGPLTEADAYITRRGASQPAWTNVLVGTLGAGGKSVYALNVTNTAQLDKSAVMWEVTTSTAANLGHVTSEVQVGYVQNNGGWYAFVGNGHDAANKRASLLVIDLATGTVVKTFELPSANDATTPNGLSGVALITDNTNAVIGAYAGDLHGQIWRFEFSGSDVSKWRVGFGGQPLFTARSASGAVQMVSAAPSFFKLPTSTKTTGNLVVFGTGRLVESTDALSTETQTVYAVQDNTVGSTSASTSPITGGRAALQAQTFLPAAPNNPLIQLSNNAVDLADGSAKKWGWYIDQVLTESTLPGASGTFTYLPKVIYQPRVVRNLVVIETVLPPDQGVSCNSKLGSGYNYVLPVFTGGQLTQATFDTNGDGAIDKSDQVGQGYATGADGRDALRNALKRSTASTDGVADRLKSLINTKDSWLIDSCAAGGEGCPPVEPIKLKTISDRVWKRIVKQPF